MYQRAHVGGGSATDRISISRRVAMPWADGADRAIAAAGRTARENIAELWMKLYSRRTVKQERRGDGSGLL